MARFALFPEALDASMVKQSESVAEPKDDPNPDTSQGGAQDLGHVDAHDATHKDDSTRHTANHSHGAADRNYSGAKKSSSENKKHGRDDCKVAKVDGRDKNGGIGSSSSGLEGERDCSPRSAEPHNKESSMTAFSSSSTRTTTDACSKSRSTFLPISQHSGTTNIGASRLVPQSLQEQSCVPNMQIQVVGAPATQSASKSVVLSGTCSMGDHGDVLKSSQGVLSHENQDSSEHESPLEASLKNEMMLEDMPNAHEQHTTDMCTHIFEDQPESEQNTSSKTCAEQQVPGQGVFTESAISIGTPGHDTHSDVLSPRTKIQCCSTWEKDNSSSSVCGAGGSCLTRLDIVVLVVANLDVT